MYSRQFTAGVAGIKSSGVTKQCPKSSGWERLRIGSIPCGASNFAHGHTHYPARDVRKLTTSVTAQETMKRLSGDDETIMSLFVLSMSEIISASLQRKQCEGNRSPNDHG